MPNLELNPELCVEQSPQGILKRSASSKVPKTSCRSRLVSSQDQHLKMVSWS